MKKIIILLILFLTISHLFAANENEYKNSSINNGLFYTGKVSIYPGAKQNHKIFEVKTNSVTGIKDQVIVKCISKTKAYNNYKSTEEDDYSQYLINENCEFLASGKIDNKWIYIKVSSESYRWIPVEKISFINGSINDLPELILQKSYGSMLIDINFYKNYIHLWAADVFAGFPEDSIINDFFPYSETSKNKLRYISFNNNSYLILANESLLYLIDENNKLTCEAVSGMSSRKREAFGFDQPYIFSVSSELKEKDIIYSAKNLTTIDSAKPWVEAVKGDGIGEYIKINSKNINGLIISNGYVDFNKPNLYENNNRVKVFEVYNQDNKKIQEIELEDTPDPQIFIIKEKCESLKLVIKEVYKGNKWDDTCINFITTIPETCSMDDFIYK